MYEIRRQKTNHIIVLGSRFWDELLLMSMSFYLFFVHNGWQPINVKKNEIQSEKKNTTAVEE